MLVVVYKDGDVTRQPLYVNVQGNSEKDRCRSIAFRFIHKRAEKDYSECANSTFIPTVEEVTPEVGETMITHLN